MKNNILLALFLAVGILVAMAISVCMDDNDEQFKLDSDWHYVEPPVAPEPPYEIKITGHQVKVTGTQYTGHSMWVEADSHGRPTKIPDRKWEPVLRAEYDAGIYTNLWMSDEEIAESEAVRKTKNQTNK